jgi:hypothetical protein
VILDAEVYYLAWLAHLVGLLAAYAHDRRRRCRRWTPMLFAAVSVLALAHTEESHASQVGAA